MSFTVTHSLEMDRIPPARIEYGSGGFRLFGIAEAGAAEGCADGAGP